MKQNSKKAAFLDRDGVINKDLSYVFKTKDFEVGYLFHKKGEVWDVHYHKHMKEINLLIKGKMILNDLELNENDIFVIDKKEIACPIFIEDCYIIVIKVPSVPGDKIIL